LPDKTVKSSPDSIIKNAQDLLDIDIRAWQHIYDKAKEDLHFLSDHEHAQWDQKDYQARRSTGRPALTIDQLGQFIHQVENDIRMNTPTINILPSDNEATEDTADIISGLIKTIEYESKADDAYDLASSFAVRSSIGYIRVDHEYADNKTFDQKLCIKRVTNPLAVVMDSTSIEAAACDAKHAFVLDKLTVAEFKKMYPGSEPVSFEVNKETSPDDAQEDDEITVVEFFQIEEGEETIAEGDKSRKVKSKTVKRYKLSGSAILEESVFPGEYIPIVPVYGEESWIEGKRHIYSLIRRSKDAQRMFNYWKSLETELLQKAPKAPIIAVEGTTEDFKADWTNPDKASVLRYKQKDSSGQPAPAPHRMDPPTIPTGVVNASRGAVEDIKATMGLYNAALGQQGNEKSGIAIARRQQEGDVATFHFGDNLVKAITQVGMILVSAIPTIYDTPRIINILGKEDETKAVAINGATYEDQEEEYDLTSGVYGVRVTTGANYTTQRQQAAEAYNEMISRNPQLMEVAGDLLFKYMDFPGADALSERLKKIMPPEVVGDENGGQEQDPEKMQMMQQMQQMGQQMEQMAQELQSKQSEEQLKQAELQIKSLEAQTKAQATQLAAETKQAELQLKSQSEQGDLQYKAAAEQAEQEYKLAELELKLQAEQNDVEIERAKLQLEAEKLVIEREKLGLDVVKAQHDMLQPTEIDIVSIDNQEGN
jgi:hypothetical protein